MNKNTSTAILMLSCILFLDRLGDLSTIVRNSLASSKENKLLLEAIRVYSRTNIDCQMLRNGKYHS